MIKKDSPMYTVSDLGYMRLKAWLCVFLILHKDSFHRQAEGLVFESQPRQTYVVKNR